MKIYNASPGFGKPLTENEITDFLTNNNNKLNIHIGTLDSKREPNIHPTWYYFLNNRFYIETSKKSKKTENLNTNNVIYYCVDDPNPPYKGVRGKGRVKIHLDINHNIPIAEKIMLRYLGSLEHSMAKSLMSGVRSGDSVILEIYPSYYSTWDYSKKK